MNIFKNKVGRPSNNMKKTRRMVIISLVVLTFLLAFLGIKTISFSIMKTKESGSTNSLKGSSNKLSISCPEYASVGEQFICTTNISGTTFTASSKNLAEGYKSKLISNKIRLRYTKTGNAKIIVSRSGYSSVQRTVKIIVGKDGLRLNCPESSYVNQKFTCTTNSTKATVRVSKEGLSNHYMDLLTKSNGIFKTPKKEVNLLYTKKGYAKVVAEQKGFKPVTRHVQIVEKTPVGIKYSDDVINNFAAVIGAEAGANPEGFEAQLVTGAIILNNMYFSCGRSPFVTSSKQINKTTLCKTLSYQSLYSPKYCNYTLNTLGFSATQKKQLIAAAKLVLSGIFTIPKEINCEGKLSNWKSNGKQIAVKWGHLATKNGCKMDDTYEDGCSQVYAYSKYCVSGKISNKDVNGNKVSTNFNDYKSKAAELYKQYVTKGQKVW